MFSSTELWQLFKHPQVLKAYSDFKEFSNKNYPNSNYFGLNFNDLGELVSVKFYFAFFHRLPQEVIEKFLPTTADFNSYYHLWEPSKERTLEHTGCTFEVKFKQSSLPTLGFHFRLKPTLESYNLIGFPEFLPFSINDLGTRPGINYEYEPNQVLRKKYFYLEKQEHKNYIAESFQKPFAKKVNLVEYTEAKNLRKVNLWRFDFSKENKDRPNYFQGPEQEILLEIKEKLGLIPISDGFHENGKVKAVYFFHLKSPENLAPFEDSENFSIDTLKLL